MVKKGKKPFDVTWWRNKIIRSYLKEGHSIQLAELLARDLMYEMREEGRERAKKKREKLNEIPHS